MDWPLLATQLVRARRGARTQKQLSRALAYQSNVVFAWEAGRDVVSATSFFRLASLTGSVDISDFVGRPCGPLEEKKCVARFMKELLGKTKASEVALELGRDRHAVGRWLRGQTEVPLGDLLHFIELTTLRIYDFLALYVDPHQLAEA